MSEWDLTHGINEWEKKGRVWGGKVILVNVQETAAARKGDHTYPTLNSSEPVL